AKRPRRPRRLSNQPRGLGSSWRSPALPGGATAREAREPFKKGARGGNLVSPTALAVVVEGELRWVRPQLYGVDLVLALVGDPGLQEVGREDAALREERVVGLQRIQRLAERAGDLGNLRLDLVEEVVVGGGARVEPALDPIQAGH